MRLVKNVKESKTGKAGVAPMPSQLSDLKDLYYFGAGTDNAPGHLLKLSR